VNRFQGNTHPSCYSLYNKFTQYEHAKMQFKRHYLNLFIASALSLAPVIIDANTSLNLYSSAQAKGGSSGGNGNSGNNGGSNGGGNGGGNSASNNGGNAGARENSSNTGGFGAAASDRQVGSASGGRWGDDGSNLGNNHGSIASALGALNAAHASENALANASANSRVGLIAAYKASVEDGIALQDEFESASENLAILEAEKTALEVTLADQNQTLRELETAQQELNDLEDEDLQELADALGLETVEPDGLRLAIESEYNRLIATVTTEIDSTEAVIDMYNGEEGKIAKAQSDLDLLEEQTEKQAYLELTTLEAAANKTLSPDVMDTVNELLDIQSAYREAGDELASDPDA